MGQGERRSGHGVMYGRMTQGVLAAADMSHEFQQKLNLELRDLMQPFPVLGELRPLAPAGETRDVRSFLTKSIAKMQSCPPGSKHYVDMVGVGGISKSTNIAGLTQVLEGLSGGNFAVLVEEFADAVTLFYGKRVHDVPQSDYAAISAESAFRVRMAAITPVEALGYDPDTRLVIVNAAPVVTQCYERTGSLIGVRRGGDLVAWQAADLNVRDNTYVFANTASPKVEQVAFSARTAIEDVMLAYQADNDWYKAVGMIRQVLRDHNMDFQATDEKLIGLHDSWASARVMKAHRRLIAENMSLLFEQGLIDAPTVRQLHVPAESILKSNRLFNQLYGGYLRHLFLEQYALIPDQVYFGNNTKVNAVSTNYDLLDSHKLATKLARHNLPFKLPILPTL